jgi:hypothetical protein
VRRGYAGASDDGDLHGAFPWGSERDNAMRRRRLDGRGRTRPRRLFFVWVFWPSIDHGEGRIFRASGGKCSTHFLRAAFDRILSQHPISGFCALSLFTQPPRWERLANNSYLGTKYPNPCLIQSQIQVEVPKSLTNSRSWTNHGIPCWVSTVSFRSNLGREAQSMHQLQ